MGSGYGPVIAADASGLAAAAATQPVDPTSTTNLAFYGTPYTDSAGTVYTGDNGYTVVDSYSCSSGDCGGFTMGSGYGPVIAADSTGIAAAALSQPTTGLSEPFYGNPYMDSSGYVYTGDNGYTVTDSYSCKSGACGGFTMGPVIAADATGIAAAAATQPVQSALAPPVASTSAAQDLAQQHQAGGVEKPCNPHPSHYVLCGHAMVLGAFAATGDAAERMLKGKEVSGEEWGKTFARTAEEAVKSVSPVGGYILSKQLLGK